MTHLDESTVLCLHRMLTRETGGNPGLRDKGLLDSALFSAFQTFGGAELYPTPEEKAARIGFSLIANHAFLDGNKRIGLLTMLTLLEMEGISLSVSDKELVDITLSVAAGRADYGQLLAFIENHKHT